jgi:hypothetical protein
MKEMKDTQVEDIIEGLTGDIRVGKKYYFFTVVYHYIGVVEAVSKYSVKLGKDSLIVMNAGSSPTAVSEILAGKAKPEVSENPKRSIFLPLACLSAFIEF